MRMKTAIVLVLVCTAATVNCTETQTVAIEVIGANGTISSLEIDRNAQSVAIEKVLPRITEIRGLEGLLELSELTISNSNISSMNFYTIASIENLDVLRLRFVTLQNLSFLADMKDISAIVIEEIISFMDSTDVINLSESSNMEYLRIGGGIFTGIPMLTAIPPNFSVLDLVGAGFSSLDSEDVQRIIEYQESGITVIVSERFRRRLIELSSNLELPNSSLSIDLRR